MTHPRLSEQAAGGGETPSGYAIIQPDMMPHDGARVLVAAFGQLQFTVVTGGTLITADGESIEGDALEDVQP